MCKVRRMEYGGLDAFIDDLYIRPSHRRRGLGQAVLESIFTECSKRGVLALHVEVGQDNTAAIALYNRNRLHPRDDDRQMLTRRLDFAPYFQ